MGNKKGVKKMKRNHMDLGFTEPRFPSKKGKKKGFKK